MLTTKASYLFMRDKVAYDTSLDTGDKSLQCGRLNDALKIWLTLKKNVRVTSCWRACIHLLLCAGPGMVGQGGRETDAAG